MNNRSIKTTIFSLFGGDAAGRGGLKKFLISTFAFPFFASPRNTAGHPTTEASALTTIALPCNFFVLKITFDTYFDYLNL